MPTVTTRSLIRMGDGGLVITIPKSWAKYYKLKPGDKVEIITNGELIIRPEKEKLSSSRRQKPNCK